MDRALLHRFLDHVARRFPEFALKRRSIGQGLEQLGARERHFGVVHGVLDLVVDLLFKGLHRAPELILDSSHFFDLRRITEQPQGFGKRCEGPQGSPEGSQRFVLGEGAGLNRFNQIAQDVEGLSVVREPVDGSLR